MPKNRPSQHFGLVVFCGSAAVVLVAGFALITLFKNSPAATAGAFAFTGGLLMLGGVLYLLPSYVAVKREHKNALGVCLLNLFFGWTLLGWVGALIWAVAHDQPVTYPPIRRAN